MVLFQNGGFFKVRAFSSSSIKGMGKKLINYIYDNN